VYAMGGEVLLALNIAGFPADLPREMIAEIFLGAAEVVRAGGGVVAGGHTVTDAEPKFGLVVTGTIHPDHIVTLAGAQPGDQLILTKPLGSGIIATAARADALHEEAHLAEAIKVMSALNRGGAAAMRRVGVSACTDITGFGLLGHASEMAEASGVGMVLHANTLPLLTGALIYAREGKVTGGAKRNRDFFTKVTVDKSVEPPYIEVAWDPQTSGGLLIAVSASKTDALLMALDEEGIHGYPIGHVSEGEGIALVTEGTL
nr:selenide, water dikinase SelD [Ardenticatenales bacterium]